MIHQRVAMAVIDVGRRRLGEGLLCHMILADGHDLSCELAVHFSALARVQKDVIHC